MMLMILIGFGQEPGRMWMEELALPRQELPQPQQVGGRPKEPSVGQ